MGYTTDFDARPYDLSQIGIWPDLDVVKVRRVEPYELFELGMALDWRNRSVPRDDQIPGEVRRFIIDYLNEHKLHRAYQSDTLGFIPAYGYGEVYWRHGRVTGQAGTNTNVLGYLKTRLTRWNEVPLVFEVELGCAHEWETLSRRNCYVKARCTKCSSWYECDSSD